MPVSKAGAKSAHTLADLATLFLLFYTTPVSVVFELPDGFTHFGGEGEIVAVP